MPKKYDARITLTMEPNGIFRMEIHDPLGKKVIFSNPSDKYKTPYADMEKAIGQTVEIILRKKEEEAKQKQANL